ncbi:DNA (cytosine-5-)-methyltransferase [Bacillus glycinifermentans]|uniref:Cytosine-specific methyltransferase n=1 Tax=Bacillus glycinifermentans TaxID=1664069 RepID=A0A0T6BPT1_9BACI|nr:DNA (cytosine-5-)-methyltransferase [Bacillus glycinifermentans]ATH94646.1 DNA (cytosine-5-)-methyltransferase [Bacillus glycinifermentans]KRT93614.1 DNA methyltransferase [Bacillus glycinifermentans]MEC0486062.1 DNA (cytosine-5-)-methyltransferase [Bacillus glycinifermentans]
MLYRFIDLFAGIGGIRTAFEPYGECVFSCEWDIKAQETYEANFGEKPVGDIRQVNEKDVPDHDILLAGFPCQPFSIAGVSKKKSLGREHGFLDETQGTLFFDIARILKEKKPQAFLLENVKNLKSHDKGKTFKVIMNVLEGLGYTVYAEVLNAKGLVPQNRERIYIVGFKNPLRFEFPEIPNKGPALYTILEKNVDEKYTLSDKLWKYLQDYKEKHSKKGNGFGYGLADLNSYTRTLSARYYKDGSEILIPQGDDKNPRKLTPRECARLQGFPETFKIVVSNTAAYKQFGNSVAVPVVSLIAEKMIQAIERNEILVGVKEGRLEYATK